MTVEQRKHVKLDLANILSATHISCESYDKDAQMQASARIHFTRGKNFRKNIK